MLVLQVVKEGEKEGRKVKQSSCFAAETNVSLIFTMA